MDGAIKSVMDHLETLRGEYEERAEAERIAARQAEGAGMHLTAAERRLTAARHAGTALGLTIAITAIESAIESNATPITGDER